MSFPKPEPGRTVFGGSAVPPAAALPWVAAEDGGPCPALDFEGGEARLYPFNDTDDRYRVNVIVSGGELNWSGSFEAFGPLKEVEEFVREIRQFRASFPKNAKLAKTEWAEGAE